MSSIADHLKNVHLFADLNDAQRERIAAVCRRRLYHGKQHLFHEGDRGGQLYIVLSGGVKIYSDSMESGQETILALLSPGEFFGEMALLCGGERTASAVTIAEQTELLILDQTHFLTLLRESFELTSSLIRNLAERLKATNEKLKDWAGSSSLARIAKLLLVRSDPASGKLCPPLTQDEIAHLIGVRRETVARNLSRLEDIACLRRNRGNMTITNRELLERTAKTG
jgi:CRP/FNR family transcriptional regulator, cyclic AMP receptor protein